MNPLRRKPVSKRGSARQFHKVGMRTKSVNTSPSPQRGGFRL